MRIFQITILAFTNTAPCSEGPSFWESVSLSDEAGVFSGIIRDIKDYQTIFLIGHIMGGLLCMAAITALINTRQQESLSRIGGMILMATPQTGSQRVMTPLSWLSKDFYALKPHGEFVTGLHDTLVNNRVVLDETRAKSGDIVIPTWAVLGASDHWVDKLSAGLNLPEARKRTVRGSHKAIVKPKSKQSDAYEYVRDRIKEACSLREGTKGVFSRPGLPWSPLVAHGGHAKSDHGMGCNSFADQTDELSTPSSPPAAPPAPRMAGAFVVRDFAHPRRNN